MPEKREHKEIIRAYWLVLHRQFFKHVADIILSKEQSTSIQAIEIKIYIMCRRKWILQWQTLLHERNEPNTSKPNPQFSNIQLCPTKPQNWLNPHGFEMSLPKEGRKNKQIRKLTWHQDHSALHWTIDYMPSLTCHSILSRSGDQKWLLPIYSNIRNQ